MSDQTWVPSDEDELDEDEDSDEDDEDEDEEQSQVALRAISAARSKVIGQLEHQTTTIQNRKRE